MGKLKVGQAWRNQEKVSKDQGMEELRESIKYQGMQELRESKHSSRHGGTMGKLKAWRNQEKVRKYQGMEELGEK